MAEFRNIRWSKLLKDLTSKQSLEILLKSRSLQWALTYAFRQQNHIILNELEDLILEYKGIRYHPHPLNYPRIFEAYDRYKVNEIRYKDTVADYGANIGSFSLPAAMRCKEVIAIEPMFFKDLKSNIKLNHIYNIDVITNSIVMEEVDCQEYKGKASTTKIYMTIRPTFVRMDIGGAEWLLKPSDIISEKVRHFEGEFHFWTKEQREKQRLGEWLRHLESRGFGYVLRWSKHKHWAYISADKTYKIKRTVQLKDGSFLGKSKKLWNLDI